MDSSRGVLSGTMDRFKMVCRLLDFLFLLLIVVASDIAATLKTFKIFGKNGFLASVLFKESPPSIRVTRNPNWSTKILWFGTDNVKEKILSPFKRPV
jgi:hypothetical protein